MLLTTLVIDDSTLQRLATCKNVQNHPNLVLSGSYADPVKGLEAVKRVRPDVLFLDVEMPKLNGFDILKALDFECQVILNSTRGEFAFPAYRFNAVKDFLMKPMQLPRFNKAVEKVVNNISRMAKAS